MSSSAHPIDPVNVSPIPPLQDSYTYHSDPYQSSEGEEWIMGIDEAGRGRGSFLPAANSPADVYSCPWYASCQARGK
jgi:hypothetical protein